MTVFVGGEVRPDVLLDAQVNACAADCDGFHISCFE
jgi:hypothetical protein